jgi:hypothetical protein
MNDDSTTSTVTYWWVNQGKTFNQAIKQGYLWAPQKNAKNQEIFHWKNVNLVQKGDIIFHYANGFIKAVSKAKADSYPSVNDLDKKLWNEDGWRVDTEIYIFDEGIPIKKIGYKIYSIQNDYGPISISGGANMGYLFRLSLEAKDVILNEVKNSPFPELAMAKKQLVGLVNQTLLSTLENLKTSCNDVNLKIGDELYLRFIASISSKRFTILTGLAGSGKTKLAQAFSQWICPAVGKDEENPYYALVPVGADWMGNENILGYANGLKPGEYISKPALELILHAKDHPNAPHFLILDEMNLSHVERYFADILSAIESGAPIPLHREMAMKAGELEVPPSVVLPANLFIIGTVNVDETTYMFSPKVLDRANVIEFRMAPSELTAFLNAPKAPNLDALNGLGNSYGAAFVAAAKNKDITVPAEVQDPFTTELALLFTLLQKHNAEFGYRVAYEAARFMHFYKELSGAPDKWFDKAMDAVIVQKLLPKLHGSRSKLEGLLEALAWLCADGSIHGDTDPAQVRKAVKETGTAPRYPLSFEKVMRMWEKLVREQFVSFAEA